MPRELNVEKLERKFASLTKSRESIQAVSSWIMHHHEFCEEIVEQWFIALTKDLNALVMIYVANEIIQSCGKKKCPQYREAFSKVLEKAASLEKVKEIKSDVCRILSLWKERSIFDDDFFQRLETKLNDSEVISPASVEEDEVSELEIITNYKSSNLFESLKRLKAVEMKAKEKEEILSYADEPLLPELSNLTVRDECFEMLKKIDSFCKHTEELLKAINDEIKVRKNAEKELKNSCVFYTAQQRDVKKVASAYMTYGKRLKNMERKLSEKMLIFPSPIENDSPNYSESNAFVSPIVGTSPFDHDTSSVSRTSSRVSPGASSEKSRDTMCSSENMKSSISFWSKISKRATSDFPKNFELKFDEILQKRSEQSPKQKFSKLAELFAETKSDSEKLTETESTSLDSPGKVSNLKCFSSPNQQDENLFDLQITADQPIDIPKNTECSTEKPPNQETSSTLDHVAKETLNEKKRSKDDSEIDFLLDESYDTKKAKSNVSVKRKIELLQSKGKKICTDDLKERKIDSVLPSNSSAAKPVKEIKSSEDAIHEDAAKINNCNTGIDQNDDKANTESKVTVPMVSPGSIMTQKTPPISSATQNIKLGVKNNLSLDERIQNVSNNFQSSAMEQCREIEYLAEKNYTQDPSSNDNKILGENKLKNNSSFLSEINFDTENSKVPENEKIPIPTPSISFDSSLFSSISSLSTEFLKNILGKNKSTQSQDTEDNYVTDTYSVNDSTDSEKLIEGKDSEIIKQDSEFNLAENVPTAEEKLIESNTVTEPLSQSESTENVKNEISIKDEISITDTASLDDTSIKSNDSEQQTFNEKEIQFCDNKEEKKLLCSETTISDIQLKTETHFETEKADEKPDLQLTLQNVLECISNKSLSFSDSKNVCKPTPTFENCLNMYHVLRSIDTKYTKGSNLSSSENEVFLKTASESVTSGVYSQDNLEVMDMECDSE